MTNGWTLAIDTATGINVGLAKDGEAVASAREESTRKHVELTQQLVNQTLEQAGIEFKDLSQVAVGVGPGPFTGLRVGIVTGTTIASMLKIPVRGVCTLDAISLGVEGTQDRFVVVTDARRKEIYWASYDRQGKRDGEPQVSIPEEVEQVPAYGPGVSVYPTIFTGGKDLQLDAGLLAARLELLPDVGLSPIYLRKPDAKLPATRKSTLGHRRITLPEIK